MKTGDERDGDKRGDEIHNVSQKDENIADTDVARQRLHKFAIAPLRSRDRRTTLAGEKSDVPIK